MSYSVLRQFFEPSAVSEFQWRQNADRRSQRRPRLSRHELL